MILIDSAFNMFPSFLKGERFFKRDFFAYPRKSPFRKGGLLTP